MPENRPFVLSIAGFDPSGVQEFWQTVKLLNSTKFMVWLSMQIRSNRNEF
jgi:hypothetical protein